METELPNQALKTKPAGVPPAARAGMISSGFLVLVMGGLFAGLTNLGGWLSPARPAPLQLTTSATTASYSAAPPPAGFITVTFDPAGQPSTTAESAPGQLEPLRPDLR